MKGDRRAEEVTARYRVVADAAPVLLWMADDEGRWTFVNAAWLAFTGRTADQALGHGWVEAVHPDDREACLTVLRETCVGMEPFEAEYRLQRADGEWRWVLDRAVVLAGADGRCRGVVGACLDITERRRDEQELLRSREELRLALDAGNMGTWVWERRTGRVTRDPNLQALYGLDSTPSHGDFEEWTALVHPDDRERVLREVERAVAQGGTYELEHRVVRADGGVRWLERRGEAYFDESGEVLGTRGLVIDITARKQAEEERNHLLAAEQEARRTAERIANRLARLQETEQQRARRQAFLAEASRLLGSSFDYGGALAQVARLAVPVVADACSVHLLDVDGTLRTAGAAALGEGRSAPDDDNSRPGTGGSRLAEVMATGMPLLVASVDGEWRRQWAASDGQVASLDVSGVRSVLAVPLRSPDQPLGVVVMAMGESARCFGADDVPFVEDLAARAASAVVNGRSHQARTDIAHTLQHSLLPPEVPVLPGLELAARYRPVGHDIQVGGDFYDVFPAGDGRWGVVIGDVSGKGVPAASLTALARYTVRAAARRETSASSVLHILNNAVLDDGGDDERFCTVAMAFFRHGADGASFTVSCGGQPLPLLLDGRGSTRSVGEPGTAVGLISRPSLTDVSYNLGPGEVLVFYTDGVVEARSPEGRFADGLLEATVAACVGLPAEAVAEAIEAAVLDFAGGSPKDDLALLVVRRPPLLFSEHIGPGLAGVPRARRRLGEWLAVHLPDAPELVADVLLLANELTTNAERVTRAAVDLHVFVEVDRVTVDVSDDGPGFGVQPPPATLPPPDADAGRGLQIVARLGDHHVVRSSSCGTLVRSVLKRVPR